jgi:FKBP-type peptidyl-prolyl cis-trans isomerase
MKMSLGEKANLNITSDYGYGEQGECWITLWTESIHKMLTCGA